MSATVTINGKNAQKTWGIVFSTSAISALRTPPPNKDYIEDSSRLEDGKRVITSMAKVDSRSLTLSLSMYANNEEDFYSKYDSFCEELAKALLNVVVGDRSQIVYKLIYKSCNQYTEYNGRLANFSLRVEEPNPKDRALSQIN